MNVKLIQVWNVTKNTSDSPNCTQTLQYDRWNEHWNVFIYPYTFLLISKLVDIMERAEGDKYI